MKLRAANFRSIYFPAGRQDGNLFEALTPWYFEAASWLRRFL